MNVKHIYIYSGWLSIIAGTGAALSVYSMNHIFYGIPLAILGFIFSGINIFLNVKHYSEQEMYPKGYVGMFLSSLPVIFLMLVIFKFRS